MLVDTVVVGAGLFGAVIAAQLRSLGMDVTTIDAGEKNAGSRPAACLMKPGWFSGLGRDVYEPSLKLLDDLYGVQDIEFKVNGLGRSTVHWVPPRSILKPPDIPERVTRITRDGPGWLVTTDLDREVETYNLVVAAGVWCSELLEVPGLTGRAGVAYRWADRTLEQPFIEVWAPYKQTVGFNRSNKEVWCGDGTSIKPENWTGKREAQSAERCAKAVGLPQSEADTLFGVRPYVPKAKPCVLEEYAPRLWLATGGAKNGTIAAGYCAHVIGEALR